MRDWAYNCEFIKDCYDIFVWPLVNNGVWGWGWYLDPAIVIFCSVSDCYCENRAQVATLALGGAARLPDMLSEIVIIINKCPRSLLVRGFQLVNIIVRQYSQPPQQTIAEIFADNLHWSQHPIFSVLRCKETNLNQSHWAGGQHRPRAFW